MKDEDPQEEENQEDEAGGDVTLTRTEWFKGALIAIGTFGINHWYWTSSGGFYPIVVWGAPLFGLVCIVGVFFPKQLDYPWLMIFTALIGLALGLAIHHRVYGF